MAFSGKKNFVVCSVSRLVAFTRDFVGWFHWKEEASLVVALSSALLVDLLVDCRVL
jgi:hypothetical protein